MSTRFASGTAAIQNAGDCILSVTPITPDGGTGIRGFRATPKLTPTCLPTNTETMQVVSFTTPSRILAVATVDYSLWAVPTARPNLQWRMLLPRS